MEGMRWNPFVTAGVLALIILSIGVIVVHQRNISASGTNTDISAWSGGGVVPSSATVIPPSSTSPLQTTIQPSTASYTVPTAMAPTIATPTSDTVHQAPSGDQISYLLSLLSKPITSSNTNVSASASAQTSQASSVNPWSYIPSGMISTSSLSGTQMSAAQKALYDYGNAAGTYLQGYDNTHQNQVQILTDSINDRHNAVKAAAVARVGNDLESVGTNLKQIQNVPSIAQSANSQLAAAYAHAGQALIAVSQATGGDDTDFVNAIKAYDATADSFNVQFATLSTLFSANGVKFGQSDPGSVFVFTQSNL